MKQTLVLAVVVIVCWPWLQVTVGTGMANTRQSVVALSPTRYTWLLVWLPLTRKRAFISGRAVLRKQSTCQALTTYFTLEGFLHDRYIQFSAALD